MEKIIFSEKATGGEVFAHGVWSHNYWAIYLRKAGSLCVNTRRESSSANLTVAKASHLLLNNLAFLVFIFSSRRVPKYLTAAPREGE